MKRCCGDFSAISLDKLGTDEVSKEVMVATTTIHVAVEGNRTFVCLLQFKPLSFFLCS